MSDFYQLPLFFMDDDVMGRISSPEPPDEALPATEPGVSYPMIQRILPGFECFFETAIVPEEWRVSKCEGISPHRGEDTSGSIQLPESNRD